MAPADVNALCRLCTKTTELLWVFNDKIKTSENFKDVIAITTGVEIKTDDGPSQFVCKKCLECAIRMYQFRIKAQQSNKFVIDQYEKRVVIPATPAVPQTNQVKVHPTVTALLKIYPTINVPSSILKKNLSPSISLPMNFVEDYFRNRNLDMGEAVRLALRSMRKRPKNPLAPKPVKGKDQKEKGEGTEAKFGPVSPINIKFNNHEPNYQIVKKDLETKMELPVITMKKDFTESIGLFPIKTDKEVPTHEHKSPKKSEGLLPEKPIKAKKKPLFEQSMRLLDHVQQSMMRPGSSEPPAKKHKIEEPKRKETERVKVIGHTGQKSSEILENRIPEKEYQKVPEEAITLARPPEILEFRPENFDSPIELTIEKQEQCHMCHICNATQFDQRGLKRHIQRHMRCPFCKKRFRSFESTDAHIKKICPIATSMKNLPDVWLDRVELDTTLRKMYPIAFAEFSPLKTEFVEEKVAKQAFSNEVIEILSDDEDTSPNRSKDVIEIFDGSQDKHRANQESCSVIVPLIQLKNPRHHKLLSKLSPKDTEQQVLKSILSKQKQFKKKSSISSTQTLGIDDVVTVKEGSHISLVGLKSQLHVHKIPLAIKNGPFSLNLQKTPLKMNTFPSLMMWDNFRQFDLDTSIFSAAASPIAVGKADKKIVCDPLAKAVTSATATSNTRLQTVFTTTYVPTVGTTRLSDLLTTQAAVRPNSSIVATNNLQISSGAVTQPNAAPTVPTAPAPACATGTALSLPVLPSMQAFPHEVSGKRDVNGKPPPLVRISDSGAPNVVVTSVVTATAPVLTPTTTNASQKSVGSLIQNAIDMAIMNDNAKPPLPKPSFIKPLPPNLQRPKPSRPKPPLPTSSSSKPYLPKRSVPKPFLSKSSPHKSTLAKPPVPQQHLPNPPLPKPSLPNPPLPKQPLPKSSLPNAPLPNAPFPKPSPPKPLPPNASSPNQSLPKPSQNPKPLFHDRRVMYKNGVKPPTFVYPPPETTANSDTRDIVLNSLIKIPSVDKPNLTSTSTPATADNSTRDRMKQSIKTVTPVGGTALLRVYRSPRTAATTTASSLVHNGTTSLGNSSVSGADKSGASVNSAPSSNSTPFSISTLSEYEKMQSSIVNGVIRVKDVWELK